MRRPSMTLGKFELGYKQVPYDNRYFVLKANNVEVARVPCQLKSCAFDMWYGLVGFFSLDQPEQIILNKRMAMFEAKCTAYDGFLDATD